MAVRSFLTVLKWIMAGLLLIGLLSAAHEFNNWMQTEREKESAANKVVSAARSDNGIIKLSKESAESHQLEDEPARAVEWRPRITVYGRVVPNPQATADVRSPFAGTLRAAPDHAWPALGRRLRSGEVFGRLDIRAGPTERLDIQAKLTEARSKLATAEEVLRIEDERLRRFGKISGENVIAPYDLDNARKLAAEARGQVTTAKAAVNLWQGAWDILQNHGEQSSLHWTETLTAPAEGEVAELAARPMANIESGGLIARIVDTRRSLVRLEFPAEVLSRAPAPPDVELWTVPASARPLGSTQMSDHSTHPVRASLVAPAGDVDTATQMAAYLYEVIPVKEGDGAGVSWRPGLFVQAHIRAADSKPQQAVSVPPAALLFHSGRTLVYVRIGPGRFERREVRVLGREGDHWVLATGVSAEEPVVSRNAQVLLSQEFKPLSDLDND
jgi:hypothetical protein